MTNNPRPKKAPTFTRDVAPSDIRVLVELEASYPVCAQQAKTLCQIDRIARLHPILEMSDNGRVQLSLCVHTKTIAGAVQQVMHAVRAVSPWQVREVQRDRVDRSQTLGRTLWVAEG